MKKQRQSIKVIGYIGLFLLLALAYGNAGLHFLEFIGDASRQVGNYESHCQYTLTTRG